MTQSSSTRGGALASVHAATSVAVQGDAGERTLHRVVLTTHRWEPALDSMYARVGKPIVDFVLALVTLAFLLPVLLAIGVSIRVTTRSPALFKQRRVGKYGMEFMVWKFRTMRPDRRCRPPSTYQGPERRLTHKTPDDPRVTPMGRILRRWSLDELPQLWNVLRGDMSIVGPRPELVEIVQLYEPWQHRRHVVKPGITGLWQVSARHDGPMHEHVDLDLEYIERFSLRRDFSILIRTVPVLFGKLSGF